MPSDESLLAQVVAVIDAVKLDYVIVGVTAAVLHGAPVGTVDIDFLVRDVPTTDRKVQEVARRLGTSVSRPFGPASRVMRLRWRGTDVDFLYPPQGTPSFESVRARREEVRVGGRAVKVASLADVIAMKERAGRPKDLAVLPILRATLATRAAMKREIARIGRRSPNEGSRRKHRRT